MSLAFSINFRGPHRRTVTNVRSLFFALLLLTYCLLLTTLTLYEYCSCEFLFNKVLCYLSFWILFQELLVSLLLWRGQDNFSVPIPSFSTPYSVNWVDVHFPINSLVLFICLVILAENYDLFPAFFFAAVGWYVIETCTVLMTFDVFINVQIFQFTSGRCYPLQGTEQPILIPGCAAKVSHIF